MDSFDCQQRWMSLSFAVTAVFCMIRVYAGEMPNGCARTEKVKMTVVSFKSRESESTVEPLPHYRCYLGAGDTDARVTSSRSFSTRNEYEAPPHVPVLITDRNLPSNTAVYNVSLDPTNNYAFGVFTCDASKEGRQNTTIKTIFLRSDGYMFPSDELLTKRVNTGDRGIIINMTVTSDTVIRNNLGKKDIRWRVDGSNTIMADSDKAGAYQGEDYDKLESQPIKVTDEGVYESHIFRKRNGRHGLQNLIVRSCVAGKWGPPGCNGICDNCYNGGVCDDETGMCICPPGFMGANCLTGCDANTFGYSCEFKCDYIGKSDCEGRQFCLLDPYGCTCSTGYKSLNCTSTCETGKFGAGCLQECHCDGAGCDRFTGECTIGGCESGWSGTNCQIPDKCPPGYFGINCTEKCLCLNGESCDKETGECSNEECGPGSAKSSDSVICQECPDGYYGNSCLAKCHCESCDKSTGECTGCCLPQWIEKTSETCQTGIHNSSFIKVNPGSSTTISCVANPLRIILSRERETVDSRGVEQSNQSLLLLKDGTYLFNTSFFVSNVSSTDVFYCQLWSKDSLSLLAWLNTNFSPYELPVLSHEPSSLHKTMNSVTIIWRPWDNETDAGDPPVVGYIVYYRKMGENEWFNVSFIEPMEFTATDLEKDTTYEFSVAVVRDGEGGTGPTGPAVTVKTLCSPPEAPTDVQISLTNDGKVELSWQISSLFKCSTGVTVVTIYALAKGSQEKVVVVGTAGENVTSKIITEGLEPGVRYTFQVSLTTDQESARSQSGTILIPTQSATSTIIFIIVSIVIVFILATIILFGVLVFRRRKKFTPSTDMTVETYKKKAGIFYKTGEDYEDTGVPIPGQDDNSQVVETPKENGHTLNVLCAVTDNRDKCNSIPKPAKEGDLEICLETQEKLSKGWNDNDVDDCKQEQGDKAEDIYANIPTAFLVSTLPEYYSKNEGSLAEEFHLLKKGQQYPWTVSTKPENKKKNRYKKMYTYDHSRVILEKLSDDEHSNYYNASYIPDQHGKKSFIASQAPNAVSVNDFWRMIWSEEVTTVVMLTNLIEHGKDRCYKYWPDEEGGSSIFGMIVVSWATSETYADYMIRTLQVSKEGVLRDVYQVHFTAWPDKDVPSERTPLMNCIQHTKKIHKYSQSPILTHCSAGVGRTGTFISIYCLMEVIKDKEKINVFEFVNKARQNRVNLVQTEKQYLFLYKCLVDYHLTRHTEKTHADILATNFRICPKGNNLSDEFKLLTQFDHHQNSNFGVKKDKSLKNRFKDIEPNDSGRVFLMSEGRTSSSNYINATMFRSVTKIYAFISTQTPLPNTIEDFWRLIYDWQCPLVIMLNELDLTDETCVQYWPDEGSAEYGNITVSYVDGNKCSTYNMRKFQVSHIDQGDVRNVHQLQLLSWPASDDFSPLQKIRNSVRGLLRDQHQEKGPIVVHCINGVGRSCIYIAVECAMEQMRINQTADVFSVVKQMRHRNSFAIGNEEEYKYIYQTLQHILQSDDNYENV